MGFLVEIQKFTRKPNLLGKTQWFSCCIEVSELSAVGVSARSFSCANHKPLVGMVYDGLPHFFPLKNHQAGYRTLFFSGFLMSRTWLRFDLAFLVTFFQQRKKCRSQKLSIEVRHLAFGTCDDANCEVIHHKMLRV
jgi:hypothetical protein